MKNSQKNLRSYYMTCKNYFVELSKKDFDHWFSLYYSALRTPSGPLLDVGCGVGQVVNRLADDGFCAIGIDISPIGTRAASKQGVGNFIVASATSLPFRNGSFASVGFCDFLAHTNDPETCLREMVRVLNDHGKIVVSAPNFFRVMGLGPAYHWHMLGMRQRISNLCNLLRKAVFSKVSPQTMRFDLMQPRLDPRGKGGDTDAVCATNPIDMKFCLRNLDIKITEEFAISGHPQGVVRTLAKAPFIRSMTGSTFLIGTKPVSDEGEAKKGHDSIESS